MGAHRDQRVLRGAGIIAGILAIGLGFPTSAVANHQELPSSYTLVPSVSSIEAGERTAAFEFANELLALDSRANRVGKKRLRRFRGLKILNYSRSLALGNDDLIVQLKSPGNKKSLVTFELKF